MMKKLFLYTFALILFATFMGSPASAQEQRGAEEKCEGPAYKYNEVTRKAVITSKPEPGFTDEARANQVCGTVVISAVLCRTGRVTDVEVVKGLPRGLTERAVDATRCIEFKPAEKDGRPASQLIRIEYNFNVDGCAQSAELPVPRPGLLIEELVVEGNRRQTDEDILKHISTRPGDPYDPAHMRRDLQSLLNLPFFDPTGTRVSIETGTRGGVVVIFTVTELPIIRSIAFAGLESVTMEDMLKALKESEVGELRESVYDPVKIKRAEGIIKRLLVGLGKKHASVSSRVEEISAQSVEVTFVIDERAWKIIPTDGRRRERGRLRPRPKRV